MTQYLVICGLLALLFGALLCWWAVKTRENRGLGTGKTLALDDLLLVSERLKILGRPDRIVRQGEYLIPEEWKPSARRIYPGHRLQVIAYCLLIEERFGVRPPFGVVVLAEGKRVEVPNTEKLRAEVLAIAERIREHRRRSAGPVGSGEVAIRLKSRRIVVALGASRNASEAGFCGKAEAALRSSCGASTTCRDSGTCLGLKSGSRLSDPRASA